MNYNDVIEHMRKMKETPDSFSLDIISKEKESVGKLEIIGKKLISDLSLLNKIAEWRNRYKEFFFTQFTATAESTQKWLLDIFADNSKLMYAIVIPNGQFVGISGFNVYEDMSFSLEAGMRGERGGHADLIYFAGIAVLELCFKELGLKQSSVEAFSDNILARLLHYKLGFKEISKTKLLKIEDDKKTSYIQLIKNNETNTKKELIILSLDAEKFLYSDNNLSVDE